MKEGRIARVVGLVIVLLALVAPAAVAAPSGQAGCTTRATYVADVTVPDNTIMAPGTGFVKTWRIRNDGSCTWGPGQAVETLEMVGGSTMGTPTRVPLNETTRPGQTAAISIKMQAPALDGTYRSEWKFRRTNGELFGLGASRATPFYVQVVVRKGSTTPPPQGRERIQFPAGATVSSVQGRVSDTTRKVYLVRARAGQPVRIGLISANPNANFSVVGVTDGQPYKRIEVGEPWFSFVLPSTQDYRVDVGVASGSGTASYVLAIAIAP
jgi:hypothetical protein